MSEAESPAEGTASDPNPPPRQEVPVDVRAPAVAEEPASVPLEGPDESSRDEREHEPEPPAVATDDAADGDTDGETDDMDDAGPTVAPGRWLGSPDPWEASGVRPAVVVGQGRVWRPRRFHQLPVWASGVLLVAVAALALFTVIAIARTASPYLPGHHSSVPAAQHTPTRTPRRTPTPKH